MRLIDMLYTVSMDDVKNEVHDCAHESSYDNDSWEIPWKV